MDRDDARKPFRILDFKCPECGSRRYGKTAMDNCVYCRNCGKYDVIDIDLENQPITIEISPRTFSRLSIFWIESSADASILVDGNEYADFSAVTLKINDQSESSPDDSYSFVYFHSKWIRCVITRSPSEMENTFLNNTRNTIPTRDEARCIFGYLVHLETV